MRSGCQTTQLRGEKMISELFCAYCGQIMRESNKESTCPTVSGTHLWEEKNGVEWPTNGITPNHTQENNASEQTRRQWLAGLAMQGIVTAKGTPYTYKSPEIPMLAYHIADAMLEYEKNEVKNGKG